MRKVTVSAVAALSILVAQGAYAADKLPGVESGILSPADVSFTAGSSAESLGDVNAAVGREPARSTAADTVPSVEAGILSPADLRFIAGHPAAAQTGTLDGQRSASDDDQAVAFQGKLTPVDVKLY